MNCMEARRMVTPFIKRELPDKEAEQFLRHIEHCSDCMDEMDIYFTVYKALDMLDFEGHNEYDFRKLMEEDIRFVKRGILRRKILRAARYVALFVAEILLILSVYTGYELRRNESEQSTIHKAIYRLHNGTYLNRNQSTQENETASGG